MTKGRTTARAQARMPRAVRGGVLLLALAACSSESPLIPARSYRDTDVTMGSMARFDPARFTGTWYEIASFPVPFQRGCEGTRTEYALTGPQTLSVRNACRGSGGDPRRIEGSARVTGPGRLEVSFPSVPFVTAPYWVLWVDESYRTAVVGVPSGRAGWILNRDPRIPPDRLAAARDILAFNGYDLSQLRATVQP